MPSRQTNRYVLFSIISMSVILLMAEGTLRLGGISPRVDNPFFMLVRVFEYPDYFQRDHSLFWRLRPNIKEGTEFLVPGSYRTNSLGLRGDEVSLSADNSRTRIACFGNSCTFGWRLQEEETYEQQLERKLNAQVGAARFKVFNCGVPGYSTFQGFRMLREFLPILKPQIVTICYGWNDHWAAGFDIEDKDQRTAPQWVLNAQNLLSESYLYRSIKCLLLAKYEKTKQYHFDRQSVRYRVSLDDFAVNLSDIIAFCRSNGVEPILLTTPVGDADPGVINAMESYHERYNQTVRRIADELTVPLVDAATLFLDHPQYYDNPKADFIHYNAKGAERIATALAETIESWRRD
ncbi:MAG: SGNH/GDSL hydrolase family protein [candidate division Zixibacteria bacterium]|nr:SGNH/GDSL hydrolase family protein [candidate division Zixibacteria bacterium]